LTRWPQRSDCLDISVIAVRALSFCAALQAAGVPLFLLVFDGSVSRIRERVLTLTARSAGLAGTLVLLYQVCEPIRLLGSLNGVLDLPLQIELLESPLGTATTVRLLGLILIALGARWWDRRGSTLAVVGSAFVVASFALMGHTADGAHRWLTSVALLIHVLVVAFWFGSLLPLYDASRRETLDANGALIERFSYVAVRTVPAIFSVGVVLALSLLPSIASMRSAYGLMLLAKVGGFSLLMGLAAYNRRRLGPSVRLGSQRALVVLRKVVLIEWTLILTIIAATATMTALFTP
jgi:putative copper export protein